MRRLWMTLSNARATRVCSSWLVRHAASMRVRALVTRPCISTTLLCRRAFSACTCGSLGCACGWRPRRGHAQPAPFLWWLGLRRDRLRWLLLVHFRPGKAAWTPLGWVPQSPGLVRQRPHHQHRRKRYILPTRGPTSGGTDTLDNLGHCLGHHTGGACHRARSTHHSMRSTHHSTRSTCGWRSARSAGCGSVPATPG